MICPIYLCLYELLSPLVSEEVLAMADL